MGQSKIDEDKINLQELNAFNLAARPSAIIDRHFNILLTNYAFCKLFNSNLSSLETATPYSPTELQTLFPLIDKTTKDIEFLAEDNQIFYAKTTITPIGENQFLMEVDEQKDSVFIDKLADLVGKIAHDLSNPTALLKINNDCFLMDIDSDKDFSRSDLLKKVETTNVAAKKLEISIRKLKSLTNKMYEEPQQTEDMITSYSLTDSWDKLT